MGSLFVIRSSCAAYGAVYWVMAWSEPDAMWTRNYSLAVRLTKQEAEELVVSLQLNDVEIVEA